MTQAQPRGIAALLTAVLFAAVAASLLVVAYSYGKASSLLPRFAGWIFLVLSLLEVAIQLKAFFGRRLDGPIGPASGGRPDGERTRILQGLSWLGALLAGLYFTGFLVATPAFIFAFLRMAARQGALRGAAIAAAATACVWLGFVELLDYRLFAGVLFQR